MIVAKWGGSILTNKRGRGPPRFHRTVAARLARELTAATRKVGGRAILVHGAGSFGHPQARRLLIGDKPYAGAALANAFAEVHGSVARLQGALIETLREKGVPAVAVPACYAARSSPAGFTFDHTPLEPMLERGLVPVTSGDVVFDAKMGLRVLSGDEILYHLSRAFRPRRAVFVLDADGLYLGGRHVLELPPAAVPSALARLPEGSDATGGIRGKMEWAHRIQRLGIEVWLTNGNESRRFALALKGRFGSGTRLLPRR